MSVPSLGRRMLLAVALIAGAGVAVDVLLWKDLEQRLRSEAIDHGRDLAGMLAGETSIVLRQPAVDLEWAVRHLDQGMDPGVLERHVGGASLVAQAIVLDPQDRVVAVVPAAPALIGLDWSRQPFAGRTAGERWSATFLSPDRGEPGVTLSRTWSGGTVAFRLDLALLSRLAGVVTPPEGGFVAVIDQQGVVIGHSRPELARQRENLRDLNELAFGDPGTTTRITTWRGDEGLLCRSGIQGTAWSVLVFQPSEHAFAVARAGALLAFGVLLGVIVLIVALGLALRRMLAQAVSGFAGQMQRVATGQPVGIAEQPAEFASLASGFTDMASAVAAREDELRRSRAEFRELVEGVGSVILRLDGEGRILYLNPAGERLFGWSNAELSGRPVLGTLVPVQDSHGDDLRPMVARALSDTESLRHNENENVTRCGRRLWMSWENRAVRDAQGRVISVLSVGTDLTEQRREEGAFQALVETMAAAAGEALHESVLASLAHWLDCDMASISRVLGDRLEALAMRSQDGSARHVDCGLLAGSPCEVALRDGWLLVEDGLAQRFPLRPEIAERGMRAYVGVAVPGGRAVLTCSWSRPLSPPGRLRQVLELIARRLGAEMEAQELRIRLAHADRLESLGQLAGGVAHDFNNQLAVILASTELMRPRVADARILRHLDGIISAAKRSSALTAGLLAFARRGSVDLEPIDLHSLISETLLLAERTLGPSITIRLDPGARRSVVLGNPGLVQNALLNLALNARDAMPGGGSLSFSTHDDGKRIVLRVRDTGCGMSEEVQSHLFEPFFTTKPAGKGNGLGLPAVYGTIAGMHGTITVQSAEGAGTTFVVDLPLHAGRVSGPVPVVAHPVVDAARILLVEDEQTLRQAMAESLASLGYVVTQAADGQEAVERFLAEPGGFDLVLLDVMMPRMGGRQALRLMREQDPAIAAVVLTGFGVQDEIDALRAAGVPVLGKPCSFSRLAEVIAAELHKAAGSGEGGALQAE